MDIFTILQIIIALIFTYFIVSLFVSELQEQWSAWREFRAKDLKEAIQNFVGTDFAETHLYNNQNSLFAVFNQYTNQRKSTGPSYIKPQVFSELLLASINQKLEVQDKLSPNQDLFPISADSEYQNIISRLDAISDDCYEVLIDRLKDIAYTTTLKHNKPTIKEFTDELANTFEKTMERVSGGYKRNAKGLSLLLGIIMALLFNIDTFYIVDRLYHSPKLRKSFDNLATQIVEENKKCLENANNPPSENDMDKSDIDECQEKFKEETEKLKKSFEKNQTLPIGWNQDINPDNLRNQIDKEGGLLQKGVGWLISAIAIAMGAPFWFELLGKVINVRNTVRPLSSQKENTPKISPDESVG